MVLWYLAFTWWRTSGWRIYFWWVLGIRFRNDSGWSLCVWASSRAGREWWGSLRFDVCSRGRMGSWYPTQLSPRPAICRHIRLLVHGKGGSIWIKLCQDIDSLWWLCIIFDYPTVWMAFWRRRCICPPVGITAWSPMEDCVHKGDNYQEVGYSQWNRSLWRYNLTEICHRSRGIPHLDMQNHEHKKYAMRAEIRC